MARYVICKLCKELVRQDELLLHREIEAYVLSYIRETHPSWHEPDGVCPDCYHALKKMLDQADAVQSGPRGS